MTQKKKAIVLIVNEVDADRFDSTKFDLTKRPNVVRAIEAALSGNSPLATVSPGDTKTYIRPDARQ